MPLYKGRFMHPVKGLKNPKTEDTIYTIKHTKEQFTDKDEYEQKVALYEEEVWTCQCTGQIKLTHEEALKSEKRVYKSLKEDYESCFEKPVLEIVHHSTEILDQLTDLAWRKLHEELVPGEPVILNVKTQDTLIEGTISKVDKSGCNQSAANGSCSSPSSNKENSGDNKDKRNAKSPTKESSKKFAYPKYLPYKYSIKLEGQEKVINGIPPQDLIRKKKLPSKDLVKSFIRSYAWRGGVQSNSPWVVNENMVKKHSLQGKFADFFVNSAKMAECGRKAVEEGSKAGKRKRSSGGVSPGAKRLKPSANKLTFPGGKPGSGKPGSGKKAASAKTSGSKKAELENGSAKRGARSPSKSPRKRPVPADSGSDSDGSSSSSEEEKTLAEIKESEEESTPLSVLAKSPAKSSLKKKTPTAGKGKGTSSSSASSSPKKAASSQPDPPVKRGRGRPRKEDSAKTTPGTKAKRPKKAEEEKAAKGSPRKRSKSAGGSTPQKNTPKVGKMKQMTLFELKNKKTPQRTPKKSPTKSTPKKSPPKMPPLAIKLQKQMDSNPKHPNCYQLVARCARELSLVQIKRLPAMLFDVVHKKFETIQEKKRIEKMTPAEKEEYTLKKKEEARKKLREYMKKRWKEANKRYEDSDLDLKPLPTPTLVNTPDGLANELFGDVAMVTEFINCYQKLLLPEEDTTTKVVTSGALMKSLAGGRDKFDAIAQVLSILLQTLVQDGISEDYKELLTPLSEIPVNQHTVSEMVRLCLRKVDNDDPKANADDTSDEGDESDSDEDVPEELIEKLETAEFCDLTTQEQLQLLLVLCHRIMGSYSVQDYMVETQTEAAELWKKKIAQQKSKNDEKKEQKEKQKMEKKNAKGKGHGAETETSKQKEKKAGVTLDNFYSSTTASAAAAAVTADDVDESAMDLATLVKRRRLLAAKAAVERQERQKEDVIRRGKEAEEMKKIKEQEAFERDFTDGILFAKLSLRQACIGTDRDHNRYWVFHKTTPGIYVEKGWAPLEITYRTEDCQKDSDSEDSEGSSSGEESEAEEASGKKKERGRKRWKTVEKTIPHTGQNLWFQYSTLEEVDALVEALHPLGYRESYLKEALKKQYDVIRSSIQAVQRRQNETKQEVEEFDLVDGIRQELLETEMRLRNGGLGGVENFATWEKKIQKAENIKEFATCMLETQGRILPKFFQGMMAKRVKKPKNKDIKEEEHSEDEKATEAAPGAGGEEAAEGEDGRPEGDDTVAMGLVKWRESLETCSTFSRLHVLLGILDSCIKWEKSAEHAKCKICRKKGDEDKLLLCDDCNQPFHLYCLRPALVEVPAGEWFCPACTPLTKRRCARNKDYRRMAAGDTTEESDDESEEEEAEEGGGAPVAEGDTECAVCGGDEGLVNCTFCLSAFHLDCHEPPLRHTPRTTWKCMQCKSGVRIRKSRRAPVKKRWLYEESDDEDYDEAPPPKSSRRGVGRPRGRPPRVEQPAPSRPAPSRSRSRGTPAASTPTARVNGVTESGSDPGSRRGSGARGGGRRSGGGRGESPPASPPTPKHGTRRQGSAILMNGELAAAQVPDKERKVH